MIDAEIYLVSFFGLRSTPTRNESFARLSTIPNPVPRETSPCVLLRRALSDFISFDEQLLRICIISSRGSAKAKLAREVIHVADEARGKFW